MHQLRQVLSSKNYVRSENNIYRFSEKIQIKFILNKGQPYRNLLCEIILHNRILVCRGTLTTNVLGILLTFPRPPCDNKNAAVKGQGPPNSTSSEIAKIKYF